MSTKVSMLFGEIFTDNAVQRTVPGPAGVYEMGTPTIGSGTTGPYTAVLNPGGDLNRIVWRSQGSAAQGRALIAEDAAVNFTIAAADATKPRIDLLVGCHQWVDGSAIAGCMTSGQPNGNMAVSMFPYYKVVQGVPTAGLLPPTAASVVGSGGIPTPAGSYAGPGEPTGPAGGPPVILAWVYVPPTGTAPSIGPWAPTDLRWSTLFPGIFGPPAVPAAGLTWVDSVTGHTYTFTMVSGVLTQTY